jgi:hypothetical protein
MSDETWEAMKDLGCSMLILGALAFGVFVFCTG